MSNKFPLALDAFSGGSRLTAAQSSEGADSAPLTELLNSATQSSEAENVLTGNVDYSAATAAVVAAANREVSVNSGAARSVTLPDFATAPDGWEHTFISLDAVTNEFSVIHAGSDTINGVAGDIVLTTANHEWVKIMKVPGTAGWLGIGGTMFTVA